MQQWSVTIAKADDLPMIYRLSLKGHQFFVVSSSRYQCDQFEGYCRDHGSLERLCQAIWNDEDYTPESLDYIDISIASFYRGKIGDE